MFDPGAKVCDGIFIGSLATAQSNHALAQHNIKAIINLSGIVYHSTTPVYTIQMDDATVTSATLKSYMQRFNAGIRAINEARAFDVPVLVHCAAGINRSATLIGLYMISLGYSLDETISALTNANNTRRVALLTNPSFRGILRMAYNARTKVFKK
jgi:protein tyrosine/serine phosphatase